MYLNGTHRNTCKIHAGYMQDTSGYVLYRKPPPICIGNPPSPDEHHRPRIVQRLFSARLPVQVFLFIGVRSRPGGPEAVHGAAPGAGRGRGHHSNQQSRGAVSKPQHRARYSAYIGSGPTQGMPVSPTVTYHLYMAASHTTDPVTFDVVYLSFETATRA